MTAACLVGAAGLVCGPDQGKVVYKMIARAGKAGLTVLIALVIGLAARRAEAQCQVDTDCPNAACGGEVCTKSSGLSACNPADTHGSSAQQSDG